LPCTHGIRRKEAKQKAKTTKAIESINKHRYKDNFKEPSTLFFQEWPDQTPPLEIV